MISWLQTNLQKHFRVLFIVLLVVVVVSFVFITGAQPGITGADADDRADLAFFEFPLNTDARMEAVIMDAQLSAQLNYQRATDRYPYERATAIHLANLHDLPAPTEAQFAEYLKTVPAFLDGQGRFSPENYTAIKDMLQMSGRVTESDLVRVLEQDYRVAKVYSALKGPGFAQKGEIEANLRAQYTEWSALVATYDLNQYEPEIAPTEEELSAFFAERQQNYQTPERRIVDYIVLDAGDLEKEVTNPTEDELLSYFERNAGRFQPVAAPTPEGAEPPPPVTFEEVRPRVRATYLNEQARSLALNKAALFIRDLIRGGVRPAGLDQALASSGYQKQTSTTFAENERPVGLDWTVDMVRQAFQLSPRKFYSEPIVRGNSIFVLFYKEEIPPTTPSFAVVKERVGADFIAEELRRLRVEQGQRLRDRLAEAGDNPEAIAKAAEDAGMSVSAYEGFKLSAPAEGLNPDLIPTLATLDEGELSPAVTLKTGEAAMIYVTSKIAPEIDPASDEYKEIEAVLKNNYARVAVSQYIVELTHKEGLRTGLFSLAE